MLFALAPIALILVLMIGMGWGAARAGAAGYLLTLPIAVFVFGARLELLAYAHAKAVLLSLDVLLIIWAAFLLYRLADEAGAIRTIGQFLPGLTADRGMQALLVGWMFASFLQGVGGFGVPVAIISPILVGLGFTPLAAVLIPSLGHGWAVTFGSMGSSFQALLATTGLTAGQLAPHAALFLGISGLFVGLMVAHAAGGWSAVRRLFVPVMVLGSVMGIVQYLVAVYGPWNIGAFSGGLAGMLAAYPLLRRSRQVQERRGQGQAEGALTPAPLPKGEGSPMTPSPNGGGVGGEGINQVSAPEFRGEGRTGRELALALSAYGVLILLTLLVQMVPAVKDFLGGVVLTLDFPEVRTALGYVTAAGPGREIHIFSHPGMVLVYVSLIAYFIYRRTGMLKPGAAGRILQGTVQKVMSSSLSIASMVAMSVIMEHAGMTDTLARGIAQGLASAFPLASPWIGALGAFMTGSNTNSNVMFGLLQLRTAGLLGYPAAVILAAQTAGAGLASVMAPAKVVVGASTAGMAGREGEVMRHLFVYSGLLVLLISLLAWIAV